MSTHRILAALGSVVVMVMLMVGCGDDLLVTESPNPQLVPGGPLPGAIFTTLVDGTRVNANIYEAKEDVYLDGGPGPNAPPTAAGLPEGDYYFQVTDPSGKDLLSTDHISCRRIHVNEFGVISIVYGGTNYVRQQGNWVAVPFTHNQGVDIDHPELGAITVQLFPYDNTPNKGGVYKAWVTRVEDYAGDPNFVPSHPNDDVNGEDYQPGYYHGFIPAFSKTDNYKVRRNGGPPVEPPVLRELRKFHDRNFNCVQDPGEEDIEGWEVFVTDPLGVTNPYYTPATVFAVEPGTYVVTESEPAGTQITAVLVDGVSVSCYPTANPSVNVEFAGDSGEVHDVQFGNVGLGAISACKILDQNANGVPDDGEPGVPGWHMELTGTDASGAVVGPLVQTTGADGCTTFDGLLPGTYTVTELLPADGSWTSTGATSATFTIVSTLDGSVLSGNQESVTFTNVCVEEADFGTKGYWHNVNGLQELTQADVDGVNALDPYDSETSYFDDGDEPFDGFFTDGTPVASSMGSVGELIAPAGSWQAEISQFLVDSNAGADPREQLAQQLLAFIFNVNHRLDSPDAYVELPDGTFVMASSLIADAIAAWQGTDADAQNALQSLLDALNNNDYQRYVPASPCEVIY